MKSLAVPYGFSNPSSQNMRFHVDRLDSDIHTEEEVELLVRCSHLMLVNYIEGLHWGEECMRKISAI